jgi:hypothetical protein
MLNISWVVDSFLGLAQAISSFISQAVETLVFCIFYPVERLFFWFNNIITLIINCVLGIIDSLWNIYNILFDFIYTNIQLMLPYTFTVLIMIGITIMFLFRLYHFIKEVEILGNKL